MTGHSLSLIQLTHTGTEWKLLAMDFLQLVCWQSFSSLRLIILVFFFFFINLLRLTLCLHARTIKDWLCFSSEKQYLDFP